MREESAFYIKAEALRHPLIFYFGHTAVLYINKFIEYGLIKERINPHFENIFAVGVDEMDWDDLSQSRSDWPSVAETR